MSENILNQLAKTAHASKSLLLLSDKEVNDVLDQIADAILSEEDEILIENRKDLDKMEKENPKYDRLKLTSERLEDISKAIREIAKAKSPIGEVIEKRKLKNGLLIKKVRAPLGVVGIIFEARPNVFFDCFALCLKSKNACILKGSHDAEASNTAIFKLIQRVLQENEIDENIICFPSSDRESVEVMFKAHGLIDILIPRGSQGLIDFVRENSQIPTIETGAGIVHTYVDEFANDRKAGKIIFNAKTQRPSVCNALDCLIIHEKKLPALADMVDVLSDKDVEIFADPRSYEVLQGKYPERLLKKANSSSFGTEFLDFKMSIKTVNSLDEALAHISKYSSKHSEAIVSDNKKNIEKFFTVVDAAAVYSNASTRFTDGGVFGLGAEIGISTQKLHARGPMGVREITSYKWVVTGKGQVRE